MNNKFEARQYSFETMGGPLTLISCGIPGAELTATRIHADKLWPRSPGARGFIIDWRENMDGKSFEFHTHNLAITPSKNDPDKTLKYSVIIVSSPTLSLDKDCSEKLTAAVTRLGKNDAFYLLEKRESGLDIQRRLGFMADHGLVERSILTSDPNFLIWRGKNIAPHRHRSIDIIELWKHSDDPRRRRYLHEHAVELRNMWRKLGYEVDSWDEIVHNLQNSKNVRHSLSSFNLGFGVTLKARCGCRWRIDLKGVQARILKCSTPDCIGTPPSRPDSKKKPLEIYILGRRPIINRTCGDCGAQFEQEIRVKKIISGTRVQLVKIRYCPSCGEFDKQVFTVLRDQIQQ